MEMPPDVDSSLAGAALGRDAQGQPVLRGALCRACGTQFFPHAPVCPACMSEEIALQDMPREGVLYSWTTVHAGPARWRKPMTVGYVDLPNGVRVFAHLRDTSFDIGQHVVLDVAPVADDASGPVSSFVFRSQEG
jgi:uncharacterized OB-fold protein